MDPYVEFAARLQTVNYFQVSISSLFLYDYLSNLNDEITHIWKEKGWGLGKVMFVIVRYIPFLIFPISLAQSLPANFPVASCATMFAAGTSLHAIAITVSECIFALRCYAMWNRNKIIFVISLFTVTACITSVAVILGLFLQTVTFSSPPLPVIHGCYKTGADTILFATFVVIMVSEAIIVCSTLFRAHQHFRYGHNALIHSLARDGVFYCLCMFGMSVANLFVIFALPVQYSEMLNTYQAVMHTILACHMQLHLRNVDRTIYRAGPSIDLDLRPMSFSGAKDVLDV